jgi:hypothetical protein
MFSPAGKPVLIELEFLSEAWRGYLTFIRELKVWPDLEDAAEMGLLSSKRRTPEAEQWMEVICPVCSRSIKVECVSGGLHAPTVRCTCGTVVNNELGSFTRPA